MSRSFLPQSGIMFTNENFEAETPLTGADAIAPDESDTLASAVSEINADEAAINTGNDQIDAAAVAADGLETIAEQVAEANEGEGIDETTAAVIETSVESMLKLARIGVKYKQLGLPSPESFSVRSNRVKLGQATIEALDVSAKKIWQSIIDAIKKSIEWVKNFFNKIFGAAERLERRAKALKDSTTGLSGQPEEGNLDNDSLAAAVSVNGHPAKASDVTAHLATAKKLFAGQKQITDQFSKLELSGTSNLALPAPATFGFHLADSGTAKRVTAETDVAVHVTDRFPGETVVFLAVPKPGKDGGSAKELQDHASKVRAGSVNLGDKKVDGKTLKVLSIDEIRQFADAVEKFSGEVAAYKTNLSGVNDNKAKFISALEKFLSSGAGKTEGDSKADAEKKAKAQATVFRKLMDEPAASFASHSVRSMASVLQYAELSARKYDKK